MNCRLNNYATIYLNRFDEILSTMSHKMLSKSPTRNITLDFIECMIPHHQAAIYMCQNLLNFTAYKPLIYIANNIISMQQRGIEQMREIASTTTSLNNTYRNVNMYFSKYMEITEDMVNKMESAPRCNNINLDFTNEMIPHHEGAIEMCNNLLKYPIDKRLEVVANNIINEQSKGVEELKQIRNYLCF